MTVTAYPDGRSMYERIQVKAGAFMAFRIDGEDKRLDRRHEILINLWYSPEAKVIVKMESVDGSNNQPIVGGHLS